MKTCWARVTQTACAACWFLELENLILTHWRTIHSRPRASDEKPKSNRFWKRFKGFLLFLSTSLIRTFLLFYMATDSTWTDHTGSCGIGWSGPAHRFGEVWRKDALYGIDFFAASTLCLSGFQEKIKLSIEWALVESNSKWWRLLE